MPNTPLPFQDGTLPAPAVALTLLALAAAAPVLAQDTPRVKGPGYSVPIPAGFHADSTSTDFEKTLWARGGVVLVQDGADRDGANVRIVLASGAEREGTHYTIEECERFGAGMAPSLDADLESSRITETPLGPACQIAVAAPPRATTFTLMVTDAVAYVATCNYEARDGGAPEWCREVIDGWRREQLPWEGTEGIPRYDPREHATGDGLFATDSLDEVPQVVSSPPLVYPPFLQQAGIEGSVTLAGVVGIDGKMEPQSIRVVESTHPGFEQAAAEALLGAVFRPGKINGQPVRVLVQLPIAFHLQRKPER
jgi:TonB family protein